MCTEERKRAKRKKKNKFLPRLAHDLKWREKKMALQITKMENYTQHIHDRELFQSTTWVRISKEILTFSDEWIQFGFRTHKSQMVFRFCLYFEIYERRRKKKENNKQTSNSITIFLPFRWSWFCFFFSLFYSSKRSCKERSTHYFWFIFLFSIDIWVKEWFIHTLFRLMYIYIYLLLPTWCALHAIYFNRKI